MPPRAKPSRWFTSDGLISEAALRWVSDHPGSVLLETTQPSATDSAGFLFTSPTSIITANTYDEVLGAFAQLERGLADGFYAAGFVSYEAGYMFEKVFARDRLPTVPLLWFGLYREPVQFDYNQRRVKNAARFFLPRRPPTSADQDAARPNLMIEPAMTAEAHAAAVIRIQELIAAGDTYQVNFTFPVSFRLPGPEDKWYDVLRRSQRVRYAAFINTGDHAILSVSPELFFRKSGHRLVLRPMKGTARRGRTLVEDAFMRDTLNRSEKDRAENLMIVDLLRNDAGRIARKGGVRVRRFFDIEQYETVFQATSTIEARLRPDTGVTEIFRALFPCGSVTGAPKIRTMQIIRELESTPRGIYTGCIGYIDPDKNAAFSVAIRTVVKARDEERAVMGVGSGVVHDSDLLAEYEECLMKARFLAEGPEDFRLIETLLWTPGHGWFLLPLHLARIKSSAKYFGFRLHEGHIRRDLQRLHSQLARKQKPAKVRLLLDREGERELKSAVLDEIPAMPNVKLATTRTNSRDRFLFHKTTKRERYDAEYALAAGKGFFDVLFRNEKDEITEGTRSNIVVRSGNRYYTPALESGVLPGTYRAYLFRSGKIGLKEKVLYPDDLASADEIFLCNAVRRMVRVRVTDLSP